MNTSEMRALALQFKSRKETASVKAITEALGRLQPLPRVVPEADHVQVEYVFPAITVSDIFEALAAGDALAGIHVRCRLRGLLAGLLEETERERRGGRLGWHAYVEDAYAEYFTRRHMVRADPRRQQWQDYAKQRPVD